MAANGKVKDTTAKAVGPIQFLKEVRAEVKKITWPSKEEAKKAIIAVLVVAIAAIILVGSVDFVFKNLFEFIFKLNL
ncbi:preprotein translocase subunit SecE [uncultured Clostridium sp.]|jgi:preprotein translocase subunit SecE|uniref:preprotein translocase subunit SecE n=1 Tax=uncultured Clostridium sp. TaxID=59620 RepID=UPI002616A97C|nr:preprotein translocase subunit SecE [uncultured Clostridium sp.]